MKIVVDWKALEELGYTKGSFRNGCCPEMAYVIHSLIPNSDFMVGWFWNEEAENNILSHCVVFDGETTWDAEGDDAVRRWESGNPLDIWWDVVEEEHDFKCMVENADGSFNQKIVDKIRPHVRVVAT